MANDDKKIIQPNITETRSFGINDEKPTGLKPSPKPTPTTSSADQSGKKT